MLSRNNISKLTQFTYMFYRNIDDQQAKDEAATLLKSF